MKEINIDGCGTIAVMNYVDEHKDLALNAQIFNCMGSGITLVVSDEEHFRSSFKLSDLWELSEKPKTILSNGWERQGGYSSWICRKNGKYIFISK